MRTNMAWTHPCVRYGHIVLFSPYNNNLGRGIRWLWFYFTSDRKSGGFPYIAELVGGGPSSLTSAHVVSIQDETLPFYTPAFIQKNHQGGFQYGHSKPNDTNHSKSPSNYKWPGAIPLVSFDQDFQMRNLRLRNCERYLWYPGESLTT